MCWLCKHRAWLQFRRKLARVLNHEVRRDEISFITIVVGVCEPSPGTLDNQKNEFRSFLKTAADSWKLTLFGRFEVDLIEPKLLTPSTFKRKTLLQLGLNLADQRKLVAVLHVHLIAYHPNQNRGVVSLRLKQTFRGFRQTEIRPLHTDQMQTEALDNLTRYMLKSQLPDFALLPQGSRSIQPRRPQALRVYNKIVNTLAGKKGECVVGSRISRCAPN
jgi:hypothetical protein